MIQVNSIEQGSLILWAIDQENRVACCLEQKDYQEFLSNSKLNANFLKVPFDEIEHVVEYSEKGKPVQHRNLEQIKQPIHYFKI